MHTRKSFSLAALTGWAILGMAVMAMSSASKAKAGSPTPREQVWRKAMREAFRIPNPLPPLDAKVHSSFEPADGVVAKRVTYGTQFGMRVPAIVYYPKEIKGKAPAIIIVNGHGGDKYSWYAMYSGMLYAQAGAVVLTFDPSGEGERSRTHESGTREHDHIKPIDVPYYAELTRLQAGLFLGDIMQAVSYLEQQPEVDPNNINAVGYSLGSFLVAMVGAVEPRLRACVIAGGGGFGIPRFNETPGSSKPSCPHGIPYRTLVRYFEDPPAVLYALHASRGPTLVINGELNWNKQPRTPENIQAFEDTRQRTIALRGTAEGIYDIADYERGAIHRPHFVSKDVALWLERHVNLPNWTTTHIRNMPETRIGDWAKKENVELDPMYNTEGLEAGTMGLGTGLPGISRENLTVIPIEEWEKKKDQFILDSWVERAKATIPGATAP